MGNHSHATLHHPKFEKMTPQKKPPPTKKSSSAATSTTPSSSTKPNVHSLQLSTSRNLHEELRYELFSEANVFPDIISFYYINDASSNQQPPLSYREILEKPVEEKKKLPLLEEFKIDDPMSIDCTRKILVILKIHVKVEEDVSPGVFHNSHNFQQHGDDEEEEAKHQEEVKTPVKAQASLSLKIT